VKSYSEMTYDEQRKLLGLPDVRIAVVGMRAVIAGRKMIAAFAALGRAARGES
jgi:hypothetical protein